jgi:pyruvate-formate lyase-activating enzyme
MFVTLRENCLGEFTGRSGNCLSDCRGCQELKEEFPEGISNSKQKIDYINFSFYPSVCQCRCIYCSFATDAKLNSFEKSKASDYAIKAAGVVSELDRIGLIDRANARVQISTGEITINPHKDFIIDAVKDFKNLFFTNGFVYDEKISQILANTKSYVQCGLDAGTPETYKKVKGFDNFNLVINNLARYLEHGNVVIKYLVMPQINDGEADFAGIVDIMKKLGRNCLHISRDNNVKTDSGIDEVIKSVARLSALLDENGIKQLYCSPVFTSEHIEKINKYKKGGNIN